MLEQQRILYSKEDIKIKISKTFASTKFSIQLKNRHLDMKEQKMRCIAGGKKSIETDSGKTG